jgi:hypothetical protein
MTTVGEIGECWIPDDLVLSLEPVIPLVLWPLAVLIVLIVLDQVMRRKEATR